ncbi:hypothetical protein BU25DRAFT_74058 [Macroventuria anomochaeta]|uniref:Uncharacterized protein n=1 Tax=Macroventuria anomochaeta TaxID=301207 RepID=A0ACB6RYR8_9PLEO|nr:uncharacterized protein BU25DRAFT_74058 [Macroventuria anomochaeta]KAF2626863.1 hypothetical protein BU25DRAFT_74058 [Macroventuria anomochaeta]
MMTTMTKTISSGPAECEADPPVALLSKSPFETTTTSLPLQLALGACCCHSGTARASRSSKTSPPFPSNPFHPSSAGRTAPNALECASILTSRTIKAIDRSSSQVKRDCGSERGARSLRNSLHGRGPVHSPPSSRNCHFKRPLVYYGLGQGKYLCSALASLPCSSVFNSIAPQMVCFHAIDSPMECGVSTTLASILLVRQMHLLPFETMACSLIISFVILWPWASARCPGP